MVNQTQNVATVEQTPLWHQVATSEKSENLSRRGVMYYNMGGGRGGGEGGRFSPEEEWGCLGMFRGECVALESGNPFR